MNPDAIKRARAQKKFSRETERMLYLLCQLLQEVPPHINGGRPFSTIAKAAKFLGIDETQPSKIINLERPNLELHGRSQSLLCEELRMSHRYFSDDYEGYRSYTRYWLDSVPDSDIQGRSDRS